MNTYNNPPSTSAARSSNRFQKVLQQSALMTLLALPVVSLTGQPALAGKHNFEVYNDSREDIIDIYITSSNTDNWGRSLLDRYSIIPSGYTYQIEFADPSRNTCFYDIRTVFESGEVVEDYEVDVCYNDYYALTD
ncbi:hypothetical protein [Pseudanabaena sp. FACHB-2040]|uniref:hypothetical protein n=1 Tax=Pseudanabaena sp. FACHB-2040 TaxID=2692859 RepID=UPI001682D44F|nr:hypothetical protein [Pseudanabaena sp. FACHB-2040]MBD2260950.1 hypothetical protein [Pseudanabaena sp. FACHB-2040]